MFSRLGRWCYRWRWLVLGVWVLSLFVSGSVLGLVGTKTQTEFSLPDVESKRGFDIFEEHFGGQGAGATASLVFTAEQGVDDPEVEANMVELFAFIRNLGKDGEQVEVRETSAEILGLADTLGISGGEVPEELADEVDFEGDVGEAIETVRTFAGETGGEDATVSDEEAREALEVLVVMVHDAAGDAELGDLETRSTLGTASAFVAGIDLKLDDGFTDGAGPIRVTSPYTEEGQQQVVQQGEHAGTMAYAEVEMPSDTSFEVTQEIGKEVREVEEDLGVSGLEVALGGQMFTEFEEPTAEFVGVAFAIFILILAFGSVIAMGLPIGVGLAGIAGGIITAGFASHVLEVPEFAQMIGVMIGLGVGIDYALFIVTRFRENRRAGHDIERSVVVAMDTAGRAVAFAGATVVISLLGMVLMQLEFITGMAVSASIVVAVTMIAALTLLPALMAVVGERIEVTRWRGVIASGFVSLALLGIGLSVDALMVALPIAAVVLLAGLAFKPLKRELPQRKQRPTEQTAAYRWSRLIQHHPWPAALIGVTILVVLAAPVLGMRLGFADEGNSAEGTDAREAYDLMAEGFGPGFNGPLMLSTEAPDGADPAALEGVTAALNAADGVAFASPAVPNDEDAPEAFMWRVIPTTSPQDEETTELVKDLRSNVLPEATEGSGLDIAVAGNVAMSVDFTDYLGDRLVLFFAAVLTLSFLLLMVVFRSILVPLKAVVMNLLGIGAAFGFIIAGFQWGWLGPVLNIDGGPIEPFMPMMLFAIVFGLSMDYEVFLLSRVKEDWDRSGDSHTSVANGVASTARVITAAALIMMTVFGAFALTDERVTKMAGLGLGFAVLLDATIIRMLLVPATMELLGDRNWWVPRWLDRLLPHIEVEGHVEEGEAGPGTGDEDRELERV